MAADLTVICNGQRATFSPHQVVTVGRDPACTVVVTDPSVSRAHLTIRSENGSWTVASHTSTGTFHNGKPVASLTVSARVTLRLGSSDGPAVVFEPQVLEPEVLGAVGPGADPAPLASDVNLVVTVFGQRATFSPHQVVTVGRDPACTVVVTDPSVSRSHLTLECDGGAWTMQDHSSTGTFASGRRVQSLTIDSGLTIHLGALDGPALELATRAEGRPPARSKDRAEPAPSPSDTSGPDLTITCDGVEHTFPPDRVVTIGRNPASTIVLDDPSVSHVHLSVTCEQGRWIVNDRSSTGTYQGGRDIESTAVDGPVTLHLGGRNGKVVQLRTGGPAEPLMPLGRMAPRAATATIGAEFRSFVGSDAPTAQLVPPLSLIFPAKAWWRSSEWRTGLPVFLALVWLVPTVLFYVYRSSASISSPMAWAWSAYFGFIWAVLFWALVRPGKIPPIMLAEIIAFELLAGLPVAIQLETKLNSNPTNLLSSIFTVGLPEESAKALAIVVVAVIIHHRRKLTIRSYMYLGVLSGVTFGVAEAHEYILQYYQQFARARLEVSFSLLLDRIVTDGINHALWAGIGGFFIGLAVYHRRWIVPLLILAIGIPALLHGFGDYFASNWGWGQVIVIVIAISAVLFVGYSSSGDQIDRVLGRLEQERRPRSGAVAPVGGAGS